MSFYTEDPDTVNQVAREEENERVQGAYFPRVCMVSKEVPYNSRTVDNWDEVDEDYQDSDHGHGSV